MPRKDADRGRLAKPSERPKRGGSSSKVEKPAARHALPRRLLVKWGSRNVISSISMISLFWFRFPSNTESGLYESGHDSFFGAQLERAFSRNLSNGLFFRDA